MQIIFLLYRKSFMPYCFTFLRRILLLSKLAHFLQRKNERNKSKGIIAREYLQLIKRKLYGLCLLKV